MAHIKNSNKAKFRLHKPKQKRISEDEIIQGLKAAYDLIDFDKVELFDDIPLSEKTKMGLRKHHYKWLTKIQRATIRDSLRGNDVLGAAETGSGKTLAFLIPLLETLYREKWTINDRVGAIVITPTRELALQIFETVNKIGEFHNFSVALIVGGKDLNFEMKRMNQCNIVICTPGRVQQHLDVNNLFDCDNLQMLVLDEADKCLDVSFEETMNNILENLPCKRQTLLFSATQTMSAKVLERLNLVEPRYISVYENATPSALKQHYIQCDLHDKINLLWSFIKTHKFHKVLVFLSTCKQVKFVYEIFGQMNAGINLLALYGDLHQMKRMDVYNSFRRKQHVVLIATDIAARGLDFPNVHWVVQLDCPENANEYIHRAGRTARNQQAGESLLVLLPSEMKMLRDLEQKKIRIKELRVPVNYLKNIRRNMEALLARNTALKDTAQRAFVAYVKSVFMMGDKEIFDVSKLDMDAFARSLGLAVTPRLRFLQKRLKQSEPKNERTYDDPRTDESESDDDNLLFVKRQNHELDFQVPIPEIDEARSLNRRKKPVTKAAIVKKMLNKKILPNRKIKFGEDGDVVVNVGKEYASELGKQYAKEDEGGIDIEKAQMVLRHEDQYDKVLDRQKVKKRRREEKRKAKQKMKDDEEESNPSISSNDEAPDDDYSNSSRTSSPDNRIRENSYDSYEDTEERRGTSESEESMVEEMNKRSQRTMQWKTSKRRKSDVNDKPIKRKKIYVNVDDAELGNPHTLAEDEDFALQIMNLNNL